VKILAFEREVAGAPAGAFASHSRAEAERVWELHQAGVVRELYFRDDRDEAVLVLECGGIDEARAALASLPLVRAGLIDFELVPLRAYPGFARLFTPAAEAGTGPVRPGD